jgi:hypothetical protein
MQALSAREEILILYLGTRWSEWSALRPGCTLPRKKTPGTHWIGDLEGLRAGLDKKLEGKSFASYGRSVCSQTLHWLSYVLYILGFITLIIIVKIMQLMKLLIRHLLHLSSSLLCPSVLPAPRSQDTFELHSHKTSKIIVLGIIMITFFRRERCRYMI